MSVFGIRSLFLACLHILYYVNEHHRTWACTAGPAPAANRYLLTVTAPQPITAAQQQALSATIQPWLNNVFSTQGFPKPVVANQAPTFLSSNVGSVPFSVVGAPLTPDEALLGRGLAAAYLSQQLGQAISIDNISITPTAFRA